MNISVAPWSILFTNSFLSKFPVNNDDTPYIAPDITAPDTAAFIIVPATIAGAIPVPMAIAPPTNPATILTGVGILSIMSLALL